MNSVDIYSLPTYATHKNANALKMLAYVLVQIVERDKDALIKEGVTAARDWQEAMREIQLVLHNSGALTMD